MSLRIVTLAFLASVIACGGVTPAENADGGGAGEYSLTLSPAAITLAPTDSVDVEVTATRDDGFDAAIELTALDLPQGVTATTATIAAGSTTATITLSTPDDMAQHGQVALEIEGVGESIRKSATIDTLVRGNPGQLDNSFATGGVLTFDPMNASSVGRALLVAPDGNLIVTAATADGRAVVAKVLPDGTLDTTFGVDGAAAVTVGETSGGLVVRLAGSRILAAGWGGSFSDTSFNVYGFTGDGNLDQSFGIAGIASINPPAMGFAEIRGFEVGSDGTLYGVGIDFGANISHMIRFNQDGGTGQIILTSNASNLMTAMTLLPADKSLLAGQITSGGQASFIVVRADGNGTLEDEVTLTFPTSAQASGIAVLDNGNFLIGGTAGGNAAFAVIDTNLDPVESFGVGGLLTTSVALNTRASNHSVAVDAAGNIIVAGGAGAVPQVLRFTATGAPDSNFGTAGRLDVSTGLPQSSSSGFGGVVLDELDRIVAVGEDGEIGSQEIVVARIWN